MCVSDKHICKCSIKKKKKSADLVSGNRVTYSNLENMKITLKHLPGMNMNKSGPYRATTAEPIRQAPSLSPIAHGTMSQGYDRHAVLPTTTDGILPVTDSWLREPREGELWCRREMPSSSAEGSFVLGAPWPQTWALQLSEHVAQGHHAQGSHGDWARQQCCRPREEVSALCPPDLTTSPTFTLSLFNQEKAGRGLRSLSNQQHLASRTVFGKG